MCAQARGPSALVCRLLSGRGGILKNIGMRDVWGASFAVEFGKAEQAQSLYERLQNHCIMYKYYVILCYVYYSVHRTTQAQGILEYISSLYIFYIRVCIISL